MRLNRTILCAALLALLLFALPALAAPPGVSDTLGTTPVKPVKAITLTSPHGGETWQGGIERVITWNYSPALFQSKTVKIELLRGETVVDTLATNAAVGSGGQGSFKWSTLNVAPGSDYRIRITGTEPQLAPMNKGLQSDVSGPFVVTAKAKITVTFPTSTGQVVVPGQKVNITWTYSGDIGSTVYLRLIHGSDLPNGGLFSVLVDAKAPAGTAGQGSYSWVIPDNLPVSATYFFDLGCEYAGTGASGKSFKIDKKLTIQPIDPKQTTKVQPREGGIDQLNPQPEPPIEEPK